MRMHSTLNTYVELGDDYAYQFPCHTTIPTNQNGKLVKDDCRVERLLALLRGKNEVGMIC